MWPVREALKSHVPHPPPTPREGMITHGSNAYVYVRLDGATRSVPYHPLDLEDLDADTHANEREDA